MAWVHSPSQTTLIASQLGHGLLETLWVDEFRGGRHFGNLVGRLSQDMGNTKKITRRSRTQRQASLAAWWASTELLASTTTTTTAFWRKSYSYDTRSYNLQVSAMAGSNTFHNSLGWSYMERQHPYTQQDLSAARAGWFSEHKSTTNCPYNRAIPAMRNYPVGCIPVPRTPHAGCLLAAKAHDRGSASEYKIDCVWA